MSRRVVLLTEIIAPYRIPVFNELARQEGIDLHVIFLAETDTVLRQWRVYREEIQFSYQVLPSRRWRLGTSNILVNRGLWSALNRENPEAIFCGGYNYPASWEALWWARRRRVRFVLWSESNREDLRLGWLSVEAMKRCFLRRCDAFVVPGKSAAAYLRYLGVGEGQMFTAPNAVDSAYFAAAADDVRAHVGEHRQRLGLPPRFILYSGRLIPEKGVFDLIEAYARLDKGLRENVGLVFVGDGISRQKLVERAQQIAPGIVRFPGFVQREDLAVLYSLAEALVLPTHSDPWGLVVNEAMVCGLPIVVTSVAGCAQDLVEDGWNGHIVPPRDPDRLASAIRSLLEQPETMKQMSQHSRDRIRHYSPEACARGLADAAQAAGVVNVGAPTAGANLGQ